MRLSYLLVVLLYILCGCNAHLLLHWKALPRSTLIVLRVRIEVLEHERGLLQFLQLVLVVGL